MMIHILPEFDSPISPENADVILVVGASRGIGLAFVEALLKQPDLLKPSAIGKSLVILAACRQPHGVEALLTLQRDYPNRLALLTLDVTEANAFVALTLLCQPQPLENAKSAMISGYISRTIYRFRQR